MPKDEEIMFEDEEIVFEGNSLYQHLVELGYGDFETFANETPLNIESHDHFEKNHGFDKNEKPRSNTSLTQMNHQMLTSILNSQLVFKEDSFIVDCAVSNVHILESKQSYWKICTSVLLGLMSSTFALRRKTAFYLSCGLAIIYSGCFSWTFMKNYLQSKQSKILDDYLKISRKLCKDIHKHLRFLNESQILLTAKLPKTKGHIVDKSSISYNQETALNLLREENELCPHLRECLSSSLVEIIGILKINKDSLRNSQRFSLLFDKYCVLNSCNPDEVLGSMINDEAQNAVKVLKLMSELYLVLQSEYLRDIALVLAPITESLSVLRRLAQEEVFRQLSSCRPKLVNIHSKLSMQYQLHNILVNGKPLDNIQPLPTLEVLKDKQGLELKSLRVDTHDIFLLLYSAVLRIKDFEDRLGGLSEVSGDERDQYYHKLVSELSEQMSTLKDYLSSTVSGFDVMSKEMLRKNKIHEESSQSVHKVSPSDPPQEIKETILLGKTDFSVNSLDEVFLGISDLNLGEQGENLDDWCLEKRPKIPKNLLAELSNTLKSRKEHFIERERIAVKRKGLQELEEKIVSDTSSDEDSISKAYPGRGRKHARTKSDSCSSSDCEEDKAQQKYDVERKPEIAEFFKKRTSKNHSGENTSSDEDAIDENPLAENVFAINPSLANLIATKSHMWGNKTEDFYSDK